MESLLQLRRYLNEKFNGSGLLVIAMFVIVIHGFTNKFLEWLNKGKTYIIIIPRISN